ncbi:hypothetical protein GJ496_009364 [Pomphorhynchus laevis]|nr:hypothetical protein GJ496_009364 [Pomphorhynchus laevis]
MASDVNKQCSPSIHFELTTDLIEALDMFKSGKLNSITMHVNPDDERVNVKNTSIAPSDIRNFHVEGGEFYLFRYGHEKTTVLLYVIPSLSRFSIKTRLICASVWSTLRNRIASYGIDVLQRIEVSDKEELFSKLEDLSEDQSKKEITLDAPISSRPQPPGRPRRNVRRFK